MRLYRNGIKKYLRNKSSEKKLNVKQMQTRKNGREEKKMRKLHIKTVKGQV